MQKNLSIDANLVFFYYRDLTTAQEFYENILGLQRVLDYGFASIHRVSSTTFIGLVDEKEGMHTASEPKTVTLAFYTNEVDGWYDYLKSQNVKLRGPVRNATRHATRGFVAYDPEGYFLEFETFLEHPQNKKLHDYLHEASSLFPEKGQKTSRPKELGVLANVFWLYYKDIPAAQAFYEEMFGSQFLVDQGFAKVYSSSATGFIGLVDEAQGLHRYSDVKAVTVSFFSEQLEGWFEFLKSGGLEMRTPEITSESGKVEVFVTYDVGGYFLEFDRFLPHEDNAELREILRGIK
jgi:catechol 2,3-dioxygenase-like lactoylglutathione lyase family enzyme